MAETTSSSETTKESTLTEEQEALLKSLFEELSPKLGVGADPFEGQRIAPLSGGEARAREQFINLTDVAQPALIRSLRGEITPEMESQFQESVVDPSLRILQEDILPGIGERFLGTGTFEGSPRLLAEAKAGGQVAAALAQQKGELFREAQKMPFVALPAVSEVTKGLDVFGTKERLLEQSKFDTAYNEFIRTSPEMSPWLDAAFRFLGLSGIENIVEVVTRTTTGSEAAANQRLASAASLSGDGGGFGGGSLMGTVLSSLF